MDDDRHPGTGLEPTLVRHPGPETGHLSEVVDPRRSSGAPDALHRTISRARREQPDREVVGSAVQGDDAVRAIEALVSKHHSEFDAGQT